MRIYLNSFYIGMSLCNKVGLFYTFLIDHKYVQGLVLKDFFMISAKRQVNRLSFLLEIYAKYYLK